MTIPQLIELTQNRLNNLKTSRQSAWVAGDVELINNLDVQIAETEASLSKLKTLV
jgi:hypothetical protein